MIGACLDKDDKIIGTPNINTFLKSVLYKVQFEDGTPHIYSANLIVENIWRTTNNEGNHKETLH